MKLNELTPDQIVNGPVPMDDILKDSLFYPASRTDGRPIQLCNTTWRRLGVDSFVYCDFDLSEQEFLADACTMHGYHMVAHRHLNPAEYIPADWELEMVRRVSMAAAATGTPSSDTAARSTARAGRCSSVMPI